jgi:pimeloyl-ACP methyl ester carboxylesterase
MTASSVRRPTIILVHGAWADGSCWCDVISRLQAGGLSVISVQNPLTSLDDDVAAVRRALALERHAAVLVGHAWGGAVITEAGMDAQVAALVYIAGFAPDRGESTNDLQLGFERPEHASHLVVDESGFSRLPAASFQHYFAQDLPDEQARMLAAVQVPFRASALDEAVSVAAWRSKPAWYLITDHDRMIAPELQQQMAVRMNARVGNVPSSHVPFSSKPRETTAFILRAVEHLRTHP